MDNLNRFYDLIEKLKTICNNKPGFDNWPDIKLTNCNGRLPYWGKCKRGIYFFFDENEKRSGCCNASSDSNNLRVVRIGTHAIKKNIGKSTLWGRLKQHKGNNNNTGGNHRGSIFRKLVGEAMIKRDGLDYPIWGIGNTANRVTRNTESSLEKEVCKYLGNLPFIFLRIDPESDNNRYVSNSNDRKYLEKNIIGLLSAPENPDKPSDNWLGRSSRRCQVRESGLWQTQGVEEPYDVGFFKVFKHYIKAMKA